MTGPRWAIWAFLGLLVLPFWPFWIDFEQVRRGLLLMLTGGILIALPRLPRVRGEALWWAFLAFLAIAALISVRSLQVEEAVYRIAHFGCLLVVLRLGGAAPTAIATPLAGLLAVTSAFGLLQRLGVSALGAYGTATEPVSVFGNLNVGSEWTAVAAMAVAVLPAGRRTLQLVALALAGCYLVVNGSRSGMIALAVGLLLLLLKRRDRRALIAASVTVAGAAVGVLLALLVARPPPADQAEANAMHRRASQTLEVRYEIARGSVELLKERPLFGFGPGQFQVQYPRVRRPREIELSSQGRQFASEVRTAHDDWLELLVEGGLPVVFVFAAALFALQRGTRDKERLLPLFVLMLLMFARSPLGNAPAVATALLPVATALPRAEPAAWLLWLRRGVGALLVTLGLLPFMAHNLFAPYVAAIARGAQPSAQSAERAAAWMWWEPRWLQVLAQERMALGAPTAAIAAAQRARELRPFDPQLCVLLGTTLSTTGDYENAAAAAQIGLRYDPANPELRVLLSVALMLTGFHDEAVVAVAVDPHPTLRAQLRSHFAALAREAERRGDPVGAARCRMERAFLDLVDTLGKDDPAALRAATDHARTFAAEAGAAGRSTELRSYLLPALVFLALGEVDDAVNLGARANRLGLVLPGWQRDLLGDRLDPLLEHEVWFEVLRRRS